MKYIIANFKSHKSLHEYEEWLDTFETESDSLSAAVEIVLCPAFPSLLAFTSRIADEKLHPQTRLGVQDISPFPAGAYTGALSTRNLDGFLVSYALVGHSERRQYFHETNQEVANKVDQCLEHEITPIVCVTADTIEAQANALGPHVRERVIVAFEPTEHIGTGQADTLEHILQIKQRVTESFGTGRFIYGGSIDPSVDGALLTSPKIDGFLVGKASLDVRKFLSLIHTIA